jgi:hypothetical protein
MSIIYIHVYISISLLRGWYLSGHQISSDFQYVCDELDGVAVNRKDPGLFEPLVLRTRTYLEFNDDINYLA